MMRRMISIGSCLYGDYSNVAIISFSILTNNISHLFSMCPHFACLQCTDRRGNKSLSVVRGRFVDMARNHAVAGVCSILPLPRSRHLRAEQKVTTEEAAKTDRPATGPWSMLRLGQ